MVKIFVNGTQLDLYKDESITLVQTLKNLSDIGASVGTFSQQFTVPATPTNNKVFQHYYRDDIQVSISDLRRLPASIQINGVPFQTGGMQIEGVEIENGTPSNYKLGFYTDKARLKETLANDTLKDLDFSNYNHSYEASIIEDGVGAATDTTIGVSSDTDLYYPLFSPVRNWAYDSANALANNIASLPSESEQGIYYYELKPALRVTRILDAIETKYGLTFSGSFLTSQPFTDLFLWLHNREGYTYEGVEDSVKPTRQLLTNLSHSGMSAAGLVAASGLSSYTTSTYDGIRTYSVEVDVISVSTDCVLELYINGSLFDSIAVKSTGTKTFRPTGTFLGSGGDSIEVKLKTLSTSTTIQTEITLTPNTGIFNPAIGSLTAATSTQTSSTYTQDVIINNLMPAIRITDFLSGLVKMYNLTVFTTDGETYNFETYDNFLSSGQEVDLSRYLDTQTVNVETVSRYGALEFKYNESDQVLQKQYRNDVGRGYGDLEAKFNFDSDDTLSVEVPFDLPLTEVLTDLNTLDPVDFSVYKSIEVNQNGEGSSYYGAPVLFYRGANLNISRTPIAFLDETNTATELDYIPLSETINANSSAGEALTFSQEINPLTTSETNENLYDFWSEFIKSTYNQQSRVFVMTAYINTGVLQRLNLNDTILWKGRKYIISEIHSDLVTTKTKLKLITKL